MQERKIHHQLKNNMHLLLQLIVVEEMREGVKVEEKEETEIHLKNGNQDVGNMDEGPIAKQLVTETKTVQIPVTHE